MPIKRAVMPVVVLIVALGLPVCLTLPGCATKRKSPVTFVLKNCQTVEEVDVRDRPTAKTHVELTCTCDRRSEKLDARTNRTIVECQ